MSDLQQMTEATLHLAPTLKLIERLSVRGRIALFAGIQPATYTSASFFAFRVSIARAKATPRLFWGLVAVLAFAIPLNLKNRHV